MIKIIVDTLGGDNSPNANIEGAVAALKENEDLSLTFVGDKDVIAAKLTELGCGTERTEIVHAPDEISCNDKPTEAIRKKTDSSLFRAIELLKSDGGYNAVVSSGSTGAIIAGAVLKLGRIRGVKRPALCPILPTMKRGIVALCDSGANADCDEVMLHQFAVMASLYMQKAFSVENPKVALLNVGTEEEKGDLLRKAAYKLISEDKSINFVGNMEARDFLKGDVDVVVADGFSGNVLCKSTEGACLEVLKLLKTTLKKNLKTKMGALLLKKDLKGIKDFMDYNNYGGAVLLGCSKTVVKAHGSSKALSVKHCVEQAYNIEKNGLRDSIDEAVKVRVESTQEN